jgi:GWxTD domain-containing protein
MRSIKRAVARGVIALAALLIAADGGAASLRGWRDGPVSALLTDDEYRRFGGLRNDAARGEFIEYFWQEVDAKAGGHFRETFQSRCASADVRFASPGFDGWQTDRGRVFIALGEPTSRRREGGGLSAVEQEIWTYGAAGEPNALTMTFYRCIDGRYNLDPACVIVPDPTSVAYDHERAAYLNKVRETNSAVMNRQLITLLAGFLRPIPGGVRLPADTSQGIAATPRVDVSRPAFHASPPATHALEDSSYFFKAQDGSVLTLLSLQLLNPRHGLPTQATGGATPGYVGAVTVQEIGRHGESLPHATAKTLGLEAPEPQEGQGPAAFSGRVYLQPGKSYAVRYAVKDQKKDEILVRDAVVGVPDVVRGFASSSIVPAETFGPAAAVPERYHVGSEAVAPKAGGIFRHSELLRLYFQVYGASIDRSTSRARVDIAFRFYREQNGRSKRYGQPCSIRGATGASIGLTLPIGDWPAGSYRVEVDLHDRVAEQRILSAGRFSIAED